MSGSPDSPCLHPEECPERIIDICKKLEKGLMEEVARGANGPNGRCTALEGARCMHEISVSLARFSLWGEGGRYCDICVKLMGSSSSNSSELLAGLLYNSSVMYSEANDLDRSEKRIATCVSMTKMTSGEESIAYVRTLCKMGDTLSLNSDYPAADTCFHKCIDLLKAMPARYHLDYGIVLYKLGRNFERRGGYLNQALHCYEEALDFEKNELGSNNFFIASIYAHMGDVYVDQEDIELAKHTFMEALECLIETDINLSTVQCKVEFLSIEGRLNSIHDEPRKAIQKYHMALAILEKKAPDKKRKIAYMYAILGAETVKIRGFRIAEKFFGESVKILKQVLNPFHLDVAEAFVNLSGVNSIWYVPPNLSSFFLCIILKYHFRLGLQSDHETDATRCLKEACDIQKTRLGDCVESAITLTILASQLKNTKDYDKAEATYKEAIQMLKGLESDTDLARIDAYLGLADLYASRGSFAEALTYYDHCMDMQRRNFGDCHEDIAHTMYSMAILFQLQDKFAEATVMLSKCLVMQVKVHGGQNHPSIADTYDMLAFLEAKQGNLDGSLERLEDALKVRKTSGDDLKRGDTLFNMGNLYREVSKDSCVVSHIDVADTH